MIQIDMEMPKNCIECPACNEYIMCAIPRTGSGWGENDVREYSQSRPEWCPLKEQESRILDWDELEDWNNAVWFEGKDEQDCYIALTANVGTYDATIVNVEPGKCHRLAYLHEFYKKEWRCWSAEPTAKQRKAVKWR